MATAQARIGQQVFVVLDVVLRVPCIFLIDAIFNSYSDAGSGWAGGVGKVSVRITGELRYQEHLNINPVNRSLLE